MFKIFKEISFIPTQFAKFYLMYKYNGEILFLLVRQNRHNSAFAL